MKYRVDVAQHGCVYVEAENAEVAKEIANHQLTDHVWWYSDWEATDVFVDDSALPSMYRKAVDY